MIPSTLGGYPVSTIAVQAFFYDNTITSVIISDGITSIAGFQYCSFITSVTIPASVTSIAEGTFAACLRLASVSIDANNRNFVLQDGTLLDTNKKTLYVHLPPNAATSYTIPDGVTRIGHGGFAFNDNLVNIIIPSSVVSIGDSAFNNCRALQTVIIPNGVTSLGWATFLGCPSLHTIHIPTSVTAIDDDAIAKGRYGIVCSTSTSAYAKTYAESKDVSFQVCDGHGLPESANTTEYFRLWGKTTRWEKTSLNWFLCIVLFGWIWMAF